VSELYEKAMTMLGVRINNDTLAIDFNLGPFNAIYAIAININNK